MSTTGQGLDPLLAALDPDRERATALLAQQRRRLVKYFEWRGCWEPQRLADETIARVVRRLAEGEALGPSDVRATFHAVAQNLGREETSPGTEISEDLDATQPFVGSTES